MKNLRKVLAVLLSALMVVLSTPLSAMALPNPDNEDGSMCTDYDVEVGIYLFDYDGRNAWGYDSATAGAEITDIHHLNKDDLSSGDDGMFAIAVTIKNVDQIGGGYMVGWTYDTSKVLPAYYRTNSSINAGTEYGQNAVLVTCDEYSENGEALMDGGSNAALIRQEGTIMIATGSCRDYAPIQQTDLSWGDDPENCTYDGYIVNVFGFQLVNPDEEIDITEVFQPVGTTTYSQIETVPSNFDKYLYMYDSVFPAGVNAGKKVQDLGYTTYTLPQWGITGPEAPQPEEVTYTYTFADLHTEQVTAPAGEAPQAPANTADSACVSNSDGTHTYNKYSWPAWEDGTTEYTEIATPTTEACDMQETTPATPPVHEDGQLIDGTSAVMTCSKCGYQTGGETIPAGEHDYQLSEELSTAATCVAKGENVYVCSVCGDTMTEETEIDPNNHASVVTDAAVAATCTTAGLTEGSHCEACSTVIVAQEEIPALGHDYQITETTGATCVTAGKVTYTCSRCDDTYTEEGALDPNNHEGDVALDPETVKEATRGEDGYTGDTVCSACHQVVTPGEVIPALGVMITVEQNELGSTTLNSAPTTGEAQKVPYEEEYTLVATPAEDAEFVGWSVNGKLISTDATYTTAAYADLTYVPVFAEQTDDFTVTFVDQFNMVLDTVTSSELASLEAMPETYDYLGYTFANWSMSLEEVKALEANAVVTAYYAKDAELTYTVSAPGCVITVGDSTYNDTAEVGFDQAVTVAPAEGTATAWTVNGNNAAYGAEYTFYVTSDVEVAFTSGEVTAVPTVAAVDVTPTESGEVRFLATRNVPAGYTVLESGFVYGKDFAAPETDLVLENATTGSCYLYKNSNTAGDGQFALTFGITAQTGVAYARAYVIAADAEGNAAVYYADVQSYDYDA